MFTLKDATLQAESLVSRWHSTNRIYLGQGAGIDRPARIALITEIADALAGPMAEIERLKEQLGERKRGKSKA